MPQLSETPRWVVASSSDPGLALLGGPWVVVSGLISRATIVITQIKGLITPLITTHEPPSMVAEVANCTHWSNCSSCSS